MAAGSPAAAIEVRGLVKRYGAVTAIDGIDLDVAAGETFGFLGPNGAGKSTTIRILCTLASATSGSARVAGHDVATERLEVRRSIGLVFQDPTVDAYLTGVQNLRFHAELYGIARADVEARIEHVLQTVGLWERRGDRVQTYSGGMRRRLEIARGLMHAPRVLFLDEPTVGLDPQTRATIWQYLDEVRRREKITIFLTTHAMEEAEVCDRIAIIDTGRIVALDTPAALKATVGTDRVSMTTGDDEAMVAAVQDRFGLQAERRDGSVSITVADGEAFVPRLFTELDIPIRSVKVTRPTLDDVFMAYTGRAIRDADAAPARPMMMPGGRPGGR